MRCTVISLLFVSAFVFAQDDKEIALLSGSWNCPIDIKVDEIKLEGTALDNYKSDDMTYTSDSTITFIYGDKLPIAKIRMIESGKWTYKNSQLVYHTGDLKLEVIFDYENILTNENVTQMKKDIMEDEAPIITNSINSKVWVTTDPETTETSECYKV